MELESFTNAWKSKLLRVNRTPGIENPWDIIHLLSDVRKRNKKWGINHVICQWDILDYFLKCPWRSRMLFPSQLWGCTFLLTQTSTWHLYRMDLVILCLRFLVMETCTDTCTCSQEASHQHSLNWRPGTCLSHLLVGPQLGPQLEICSL